MTCVRFTVAVKAPSLTNQREHYRARHARTDKQRTATRRAWPGYEGGPLLVVRLTRVAPRRLDDDNIRGALKSVRDEVAALLRVDDATPLVHWEYGQEQGPEDCIRVELAWGEAPAAIVGRVLHALATQAEAAMRTAPDALPWPATSATKDAPLPSPAPSLENATTGQPGPLNETSGDRPRRAFASLATPNHQNHRKEKP